MFGLYNILELSVVVKELFIVVSLYFLNENYTFCVLNFIYGLYLSLFFLKLILWRSEKQPNNFIVIDFFFSTCEDKVFILTTSLFVRGVYFAIFSMLCSRHLALQSWIRHVSRFVSFKGDRHIKWIPAMVVELR